MISSKNQGITPQFPQNRGVTVAEAEEEDNEGSVVHVESGHAEARRFLET